MSSGDLRTSPSSPAQGTATATDFLDADGDWDQVADALIGLGVERYDNAIAHMRSRVSAAHALALCDHFRRHASAHKWQPVTLYYRCLRARENVSPDRNWTSQSVTPDQQRTQSAGALESRWGPQLDALSKEEFAALVAGGSAALRSQIALAPRGARQSSLRPQLLQLLASQSEEGES